MLTHVHAYTPDERACEECGSHLYEIQINGLWHKVTAYIFRSWTGPRRMDGQTYTGPTYLLGTITEA